MRAGFFALAVCVVVVANAVADDPAKKDKEPAQVREIDLKGLKLGDASGTVQKPTVITSDEELKKAVPDDDAQKQIKKDVDFSKQKLLFFSWAGSGQDQLSFKEDKGEKGLAVVFTYQPGRTKDLRAHFHLIVMPKDATWNFAKP
jgi:hypothetical protein